MKKFITGILIGAMIATTGVALADSPMIQAKILKTITFNFNGIQITPQGYSVLDYNDRIYVPARFVAEELGSDVKWDESTQTISFKNRTSPLNNITNEKAENVQVNQNTKNSGSNNIYEELPISMVTKNGVVVTLDSVNLWGGGSTQFQTKVTNTSDNSIHLNQYDSYIIVNNQKYKNATSDGNLSQLVSKDNSTKGVLYFEGIPLKTKEIKVVLKVTTLDGKDTDSELIYNVNIEDN